MAGALQRNKPQTLIIPMTLMRWSAWCDIIIMIYDDRTLKTQRWYLIWCEMMTTTNLNLHCTDVNSVENVGIAKHKIALQCARFIPVYQSQVKKYDACFLLSHLNRPKQMRNQRWPIGKERQSPHGWRPEQRWSGGNQTAWQVLLQWWKVGTTPISLTATYANLGYHGDIIGMSTTTISKYRPL